ncbi:hypothetical protein AAFX91_36995, partial [Bradyrhizobium sp. 31Argb]|uniref:hypothetical protein n=1 Tax=Bradyrhizobium sp. 31Argb TaxID=3141247 RepID=UPI0037478503
MFLQTLQWLAKRTASFVPLREFQNQQRYNAFWKRHLTLGRVDSWDSQIRLNVIQGFLLGGSL